MKTPEGLIKDKIRKWLREQGAYVFSPTQMGYGQQTVDLLVCWKGDFIAIEVKASPKHKPTARQEQVMADVISSGGRVIVASEVDHVSTFLK